MSNPGDTGNHDRTSPNPDLPPIHSDREETPIVSENNADGSGAVDELATQAMSLEEIAAAKADEVTSNDALNDASASEPSEESVVPDDAAELSTQAMSLEELTSVRDDAADEPDEESTQAMSLGDIALAEEPSARALSGATSAPGSSVAPDRNAEPTSALDSLFADDRFHDQDASLIGPLEVRRKESRVPTSDRSPARPAARPAPSVPGSSPATTTSALQGPHAMLLIVAGILVGVLVLIAAYLLGTRLGDQSVSAAQHTTAPSQTSTPTPTATAVPGSGPISVGKHEWDELRGGECLDPFVSAWEEEFTVVDCDDEHVGQMVLTAELPEVAGTEFPGTTDLQTEVISLCTAPTVLNYGIAGGVSDIRVSASYPATEAEWATGDRTYYCFITRESGEPLPGDLAAAPAG